MKRHPRDEAVDILRRHQVAAGPVYDVADLFADPHYKARQALVSIPDPDLGQLTVHNVMLRLSRTDGKVLFTGRDKGADNGDVYGRELGLDAARLDALRKAGAI